jgi:hypothetical protein
MDNLVTIVFYVIGGLILLAVVWTVWNYFAV